MKSRAPRVVGLFCAALLLFACSAPVEPAPSQPLGGVEERLGESVPLDTPFMTASGTAVRLGDVVGRGKPALVVLAYSRCSMLCSLVIRGLADLVPRLGLELGRDYSLLTISIDPKETPFEASRTQAVALGRAGRAGQTLDWPFLVGDERAVARVAASLGFHYVWDARTEQYAHPAVIFALSPEGRVAGYFYDLAPEPGRVRAALLGAPLASSEHWAAAVIQCFRFDALGRKYGPLIQRSFQGGAAAVALALCLTIAALFRRERRAAREPSR